MLLSSGVHAGGGCARRVPGNVRGQFHRAVILLVLGALLPGNAAADPASRPERGRSSGQPVARVPARPAAKPTAGRKVPEVPGTQRNRHASAVLVGAQAGPWVLSVKRLEELLDQCQLAPDQEAYARQATGKAKFQLRDQFNAPGTAAEKRARARPVIRRMHAELRKILLPEQLRRLQQLRAADPTQRDP